MGRFLALLAALIASGLIAYVELRPPSPQGADQAAGAFSAGRAMADVRAMARAPHPVGSPENQRVRDYLLGRMTALGLSPQVRAALTFQAEENDGVADVRGGRIENIVGVLPGRDRSQPALMLMAHYDSAIGSPGASDDAAGVAAILETIRAIKTRGIPARDVMVLITDGEEAGLLGGHAFFQNDPLRARVGFIMNLESRGGGGRVQMFETGAGNAGSVALFGATAVRPSASSLAVMLYRLMSNDTDFTEALKAGAQGLNYAYLGRQFDYHASTANPANLHQGTLQDLGDQTLSTAGAAAFAAALPHKTRDVVFSQVFRDVVWAYPPAMGWLILVAAAALIALALRQARKAGAAPWGDVGRGAAAAVFALCGSAAVLGAARRMTGAGFGFVEQRWLLAQAHRWELALLFLGLGFLLLAAAGVARGRRIVALAPLPAGVAASAFGGFAPVILALGAIAALAALAFNKPASRSGAWAGVLIAAFALAALVQAVAPAAAYLFAWPLMLAAAGAAFSGFGVRHGGIWRTAVALLAAIGVGWLLGIAHGVYLGLDQPALLAILVWIAAGLVWPLAQPVEGAPPARLVGPVLLTAGLAVLAVVRFDPPWSARTPQPSTVVFHIDQDARQAWRLSDPLGRGPWADVALGAQAASRDHWAFGIPMDAAPAPLIAEPAPAISLERLTSGDYRLTAVPATGGRRLTLSLRPDTPGAIVAVADRPVRLPLKAGAWTRLRWDGDPQGTSLTFRPVGPGSLEVRYAVTNDRWPTGAAPLPPRPADLAPFGASDVAVVTGTRRFAW